MSTAEPARTLRRAATEAEARALASPLRLRILRVCYGQSHTNKEIAETLDKDPATILHHVRKLVDTGFLRALPPRRGTRGSREIPYVATGKSWLVSNPGSSRVMLETFLEEVALVAGDQIESARLGLRLNPARRAEFDQRMQNLLDEFAAAPDDPDGEAFSLFFAMHPDPNRT